MLNIASVLGYIGLTASDDLVAAAAAAAAAALALTIAVAFAVVAAFAIIALTIDVDAVFNFNFIGSSLSYAQHIRAANNRATIETHFAGMNMGGHLNANSIGW